MKPNTYYMIKSGAAYWDNIAERWLMARTNATRYDSFGDANYERFFIGPSADVVMVTETITETVV